MEKVRTALEQAMKEGFHSMMITGSRKKDPDCICKVKVRPILHKGKLVYQEEDFTRQQVFHYNLSPQQMMSRVCELLPEFRQAQLQSAERQYSILIGKKGTITVKSKKTEGQEAVKEMSQFTHNRQKNYLLSEGEPVDFLIELGVMTKEGKIRQSHYDKFRQINRFLEFVEDIVGQLPADRELTILDFGCGKSYLTFAIYYFLRRKRGLDVHIIGLDLKKDVIAQCNALKDKLHYDKLEFLVGDIADYEGVQQVDMVVTLHACDTATDYALAKAVHWNAKVILSVPCCQHELNRTLQNDVLQPILKYGLLKERMAALMTDGLRAQLLEQQGYQVQILEFIDMTHTPKNILIRAVKGVKEPALDEDYKTCRDFLHASLTLERLLQ